MAPTDQPSPSDLPSFGDATEAEMFDAGFGVQIPSIERSKIAAAIGGLPLVRALAGVRAWVGEGRDITEGMPPIADADGYVRSLGIPIPEPVDEVGGLLPVTVWLTALEAGIIQATADHCRPSLRPWPPAEGDLPELGGLAVDRALTTVLGLARRFGEDLDEAAQRLDDEVGDAQSALLVLACQPEGVSIPGLADASGLEDGQRAELLAILESIAADLAALGILEAAAPGNLRIPPALQGAISGTLLALDVPARYPDGEEPPLRIALAQVSEEDELGGLSELPLAGALEGIARWVGEGREIRDHLPKGEDLEEFCGELGLDVPIDDEGAVGSLPVALWLTAADLGLIDFDASHARPGGTSWPSDGEDRLGFLREAVSAFAAAELHLAAPGEFDEEDEEDEDERPGPLQGEVIGAFLSALPLACRPGGVDLGSLLLDDEIDGSEVLPMLLEPLIDLEVAGVLVRDDDEVWRVPDHVQAGLGAYLESIGIEIAG